MNKQKFGGVVINFADRKETLEDVFGKTPIPPSTMIKTLWTFIKRRKMNTRE